MVTPNGETGNEQSVRFYFVIKVQVIATSQVLAASPAEAMTEYLFV